MVTPISDYIFPISPLPNIAPFTYKDGATYLSELERLRKFVNDDLVTYINQTFGTFADTFTTEINTLIGEVDTALAAQNTENAANLAAVNAAIAAMNAAIATAQTNMNASVTSATNSKNAAAASATAAATSATNAAASAVTAFGSETAATSAATDAGNARDAAEAAAALGYIHDIIAGANISINKSDPHNPIITSSGGGGGGGISTINTVVDTGAGISNLLIDSTDPDNPTIGIKSFSGDNPLANGGATKLARYDGNGKLNANDPIAGTNVVNVQYADAHYAAIGGGGGGGLTDVDAGAYISIDKTDPDNPVIAVDPTLLSVDFASATGDQTKKFKAHDAVANNEVVTLGQAGALFIPAGSAVVSISPSSNYLTVDASDPANVVIGTKNISASEVSANQIALRTGASTLRFADPQVDPDGVTLGYANSHYAPGTSSDYLSKPNDDDITLINEDGRYGFVDDATDATNNVNSMYVSDNGSKLTSVTGDDLVQVIAHNGLIWLIYGAVTDPSAPSLVLGSGGAQMNAVPFFPAPFGTGDEPVTAGGGGVIYDSTLNKLKFYNGTSWEVVTSA